MGRRRIEFGVAIVRGDGLRRPLWECTRRQRSEWICCGAYYPRSMTFGENVVPLHSNTWKRKQFIYWKLTLLNPKLQARLNDLLHPREGGCLNNVGGDIDIM
jgi:hypothetical protein